MVKQKRHIDIFFFNFLIIFLLFIFHSNPVLNITLFGATPILILPFLTAFSIFYDELAAAFTGLLAGICIDSVSSGTVCFNAITLMLLCLSVSLTVHYYFNRNIRSAILLSLIVSLLYFLLRWLSLYAFHETVAGNLIYLLNYALPSVIYTNIFIFPFYFIERKFYNKRTG